MHFVLLCCIVLSVKGSIRPRLPLAGVLLSLLHLWQFLLEAQWPSIEVPATTGILAFVGFTPGKKTHSPV